MGRMMELAQAMADGQRRSIEQMIELMLQRGWKLEQLELVHETYSKGDEWTTIHQRCYVRVREGAEC